MSVAPPPPPPSPQEPKPKHVSVKEVVLPFNKFPGADTLLGPEMRSTGEVMGIDYDFASSYAKAQIAAGQRLPQSGGWWAGGGWVCVLYAVSSRPAAAVVQWVTAAWGMGFGVWRYQQGGGCCNQVCPAGVV